MIENMSMDCHLQHAAWPAFQDLRRAATAMVHVRSPNIRSPNTCMRYPSFTGFENSM